MHEDISAEQAIELVSAATAARKELDEKLAQLNAHLASMRPGALPHFHSFSRMAKGLGLTKAEYEDWAANVTNWDPLVDPRHSNAYAKD